LTRTRAILQNSRLLRRAFSLAEVVVATMIVGVLLVAAMKTVGATVRGRVAMADRHRGFLLAEELMAEILQNTYAEPEETPAFGPEASETGGTRSAFDDVDDYHNWEASPPQDKDGTQRSDLAGWRRSTTVEYVNPDKLDQVIATDGGAKRITVTVFRNGEAVAALATVRTDAWQEPPYR
jgi:prepilin-type N-terminal cleavage/methylation domain-containing protein